MAAAGHPAGGLTGTPQAVLLGGFFGGWVDARTGLATQLDAAAVRAPGRRSAAAWW